MFVCLCTTVFAYLKFRDIYNPVFIFSLVWLSVVGLNSLQLANLYPLEGSTMKIVYVGVISFLASSILGNYFTVSLKKKHSTYSIREYDINNRAISIFASIAIVISLLDLIATIGLIIKGYDMQNFRRLYSDGMAGFTNGGVVYSFLKTYVVKPFIIMIAPISMIQYYNSGKKNNKLLLLSLSLSLIQMLTEAGRTQIVEWVLYFVLIHYLKNTDEGKKRKNIILVSFKKIKERFKIVTVVCLGIVLFVWVSSNRGILDLTESAYIYLCGCLHFLSERINRLGSSIGYTYGFASFYGVTSIIAWLLSIFGIYPSFLRGVVEVCAVQDVAFIGPDQRFNAFITMFYYFYKDGGIPGVIILSSLYGYFCCRIYRRAMFKRDDLSIYVYALLLAGLAFSFVRFPFTASAYILSFAYIPLFFKKRKA